MAGITLFIKHLLFLSPRRDPLKPRPPQVQDVIRSWKTVKGPGGEETPPGLGSACGSIYEGEGVRASLGLGGACLLGILSRGAAHSSGTQPLEGEGSILLSTPHSLPSLLWTLVLCCVPSPVWATPLLTSRLGSVREGHARVGVCFKDSGLWTEAQHSGLFKPAPQVGLERVCGSKGTGLAVALLGVVLASGAENGGVRADSQPGSLS